MTHTELLPEAGFSRRLDGVILCPSPDCSNPVTIKFIFETPACQPAFCCDACFESRIKHWAKTLRTNIRYQRIKQKGK